MKEITIISGKGGTGKTTITAAFASLAKNSVMADCDVDAPDLHIILDPRIKQRLPFYGMKVALRDETKCTKCGECRKYCRFDAIDEHLNIVDEMCEGCGVCQYVCREKAIGLLDRISGSIIVSETRFGPFVHGELKIAEEASGKLVTLVKKKAREVAIEKGMDLIIIDGPPGIGCPAIAAISGSDLVLAVTEPTVSGAHDLARVLNLTDHFGIETVVCINKSSINPDNANKIREFCESQGLDVVGELPYDNCATKAMVAGMTLIEYTDCPISNEIRGMWTKIENRLKIGDRG
ncbi:MAG: AAA family ATPase [Methanomassiliicoccales archaeon]|jgi:MinD superfamily P-loop ATPase|nr:AAA family ATPase [Methanomassiliicoccales archaeon]